ncbi:MAG TPA: penicillin-binding protein 2 [Marmoricola sp.]|nr:penicillin-binding protein 2 [Marmoricola sp.]
MTQQRRERRSLRGASSVRLRAALVVITMVLSVFGVRLFQLQGLDPQAYAARAESMGLVRAVLPAERGEILDRNDEPLARSVAGLMIVADPTRTREHAEAIAQILARRLHLDYFDLLDRLTKPHTRFQYVARRVPSTLATSVVDDITRRGYEGLATRRDPLRVYPSKDVAANLLGFINAEGQPAGGLEQTFQSELSGKDGSETYEVGDGNRIPLGENTQVDPVNGKDVHLTIDRDVQWYAQRVLRTAVHNADADSGAAIALDSRTGEVLALADYPTFDANHGSDAAKGDWGSRALSNVYEPGSVEKVLTTSALINEGLVGPRTRIAVPGELHVQDRTIHDYWPHGRIRLTLAGVIAKSSNIGTVLAARTIGRHKLWNYLRGFGLGQQTGVGVPGEAAGILSPPDEWTPVRKSNIAFGQGVSVNALQMASAVNTIANKGEYVSPSIVQGRLRTASGQVVGSGVTTRHRVVSAATAAKEARMMEMVVTEGKGTAPAAAIPGYRVAGKTGTAQEVGGPCHCYAQGGIDVSFAGFAPADNPRFTVYVVIKNPKVGGAGGGATAGPVFRQILNYLLQKYAVPPTGTRPAHLPVEW